MVRPPTHPSTSIPTSCVQRPPRRAYKGAPAPIMIPNLALHGPKVQIQRSADHSTRGSAAPLPSAAQERDVSPIMNDDASIISGITLPGALMLNNENRQSRYHQRGITRQDSATLPHGENPYLNSPRWGERRGSSGDAVTFPDDLESVPPVPPLPLAVVDTITAKGDSTVLESPLRRARTHSVQQLNTPPVSGDSIALLLSGTHMMHRVSPITEASSTQTSPAMDGSKDLSNASSKGASPAQPQRSGTSDTDHFLSPSSFASSRGMSVSPNSQRSAHSGDDIDQVLDQYIADSIYESRSPSSDRADLITPSSSSTSNGNSADSVKQSPDRQASGTYSQRSSSRQRGNGTSRP